MVLFVGIYFSIRIRLFLCNYFVMDPNSSPWSYAYNRIVPSASTSNSTEEFQHPHLASITAAGQSAQSLLLQAAHTNIAASFNAATGGGSFVSPSPISSYNPVFQQIYHHAAAATVQPKPAHYASTAVNTPHRQLQITSLDKQLTTFQNQTAAASSVASSVVNVSSNYYGDNSSSSGASPSPTTATPTTTTLSWNTPMISNTFIAMQQHQHQQQLNLATEKVLVKQENLQTKAEVKDYNDVIYLSNLHQHNNEESTNTSIGSNPSNQSDVNTYYTIDGKNYRILRKQQQQHIQINQNNSTPIYPIYASPSLSSAGGSPAAVTSLQATDTPSQVIVYKTNINNNDTRAESPLSPNVASAGSPVPSTVAYSSVIQYTLQQQQMQRQQNSSCWEKMENSPHIEDVKNVLQLQVKQENRQLGYLNDSNASENIIFNLPPGLEIKQTMYNPSSTIASASVLQHTQNQHHQIPNQQDHTHQAYGNNNDQKIRQEDKQRREHVVTNMLMSPTSSSHNSQESLQQSSSSATSSILPSQIQIMPKVEEQSKTPLQSKSTKTPRKRQPKKTLVANDFCSVRSSQLENPQHHQQSSYYDFNNKWNPQLKIENNVTSTVTQAATISIPTYVNPNSTQLQQNVTQHQQHQHPPQHQIPLPAHLQSSQAHSHAHLSDISPYYTTFPQQIGTQYTACVQQTHATGGIQHSLYNINQHAQAEQQPQQQQQQNQEEENQTQQISLVETTTSNDASNKVIVPNIEEELGFLTDVIPSKKSFANTNKLPSNVTNFGSKITEKNLVNSLTSTTFAATNNGNSSHSTTSNNNFVEKKTVCVGTLIGEKKTQFMDSYLRFLQGERDDSPPPIVKTGRKIGYQKTGAASIGSKRKNVSNENFMQGIESQEQTIIGLSSGDDGHKIKILSQTQILPKKRPQAQIAAAAAEALSNISSNTSASVIQQATEQIQQQVQQSLQEQSFRPYSQQDIHQQYPAQKQDCGQLGLGVVNTETNSSQDPLSLPPRREQCLRKAKQTSIHTMMTHSTGAVNDDQLAEPDEFADSDTDPVWTPQEENSEDGKGYKRKTLRRSKGQARKINYNYQQQQQLHNKQSTLEPQDSPQRETEVIKCESYIPNQNLLSSTTYSNSVSMPTDNFKTGDFIVLRADLVNDWPIIWQVDSKCILQKYEPFCQNGKMFYRNMCKYASWNLETKKLYLKAPVRIQIQSHTETIVEFMRSELLADDTEQFIEKIMDDFLSYRDNFEIYIQTMISQVLDPSFFSEITREKDEYFLGSVREIDSIMENCKKKLLSITPWTRSIIVSIETWPKCHVFTEWGQNNLAQKNCGGCHQPGISVRFLLFGHSYNANTMQPIPSDVRISYEKDILLCRICAARADIFHKIAHEKYNLYINCSRRVAEQQQENPGKSSTEILNDLLAEHNWVDELFRNMRNSWAEVESLERQKRFREAQNNI